MVSWKFATTKAEEHTGSLRAIRASRVGHDVHKDRTSALRVGINYGVAQIASSDVAKGLGCNDLRQRVGILSVGEMRW